jgi:methylated-DNA-[protein]-cysteine S-methyltransferase
MDAMTTAAFTIHPTPVGDALIVFTDAGLAALEILDGPPDSALARISVHLHVAPVHDDDPAADLATQLDEYFAGARRAFDVNLDWGDVGGFTRAALEAVREIPYGETASYGEVAVLAGRPRAHRAVGTACARTPFSLVVPAHRVVRADGSIGEYGGHPEVKRALLDLERAAVV